MVSTYIRQKVDTENSDPIHTYTVDDINHFTVGIDRSDGNKYKICHGDSLKDISNFEIDPITGNIKIKNDLDVSGNLSTTGDLTVAGNFSVIGTTTFHNTEVTTIEDLCIQLGLTDLTPISCINTSNNVATIVTANNHCISKGDYVLIQGVEVSEGANSSDINKIHQITNSSTTSFEIYLPSSGVYIVDANSSVGKVNSDVNGGGIKLESRSEAQYTPKQLIYEDSKNSWESNISIDLSNSSNVFSIGGIPKLSNTSVGTFLENMNNVYTKEVTSSTGLTLNGDGINLQATSDIVVNNNQTDINFRIATASSPNSFFVDSINNNIGIGTSNPTSSAKLDVNGDLQCVDIISTSDERYKNFVAPISDFYDLEKLFGEDGLRGVIFKWKKTEGKNWDCDRNNLGVFAQEVEKLIPEIVKTDKKGWKSVNYEKMACIFIEQHKKNRKGDQRSQNNN